MGNFDTNEKKSYPLAPEGFFPARLYSTVDLGTRDNEFEGHINLKHEVRFTWELPTELMEDGRPFAVSKNFTISRGKSGKTYISKKSNTFKTLRKWLGLTDDEVAFLSFPSILGATGEIEIVHRPNPNDPSKTYVNVDGIRALRPGQVCPDAVNPTVIYSTAMGENDTFNSFPEWMRKQIKNSYEMTGGLEARVATIRKEEDAAKATQPPVVAKYEDCDIPF
jgi:hypothetical protein